MQRSCLHMTSASASFSAWKWGNWGTYSVKWNRGWERFLSSCLWQFREWLWASCDCQVCLSRLRPLVHLGPYFSPGKSFKSGSLSLHCLAVPEIEPGPLHSKAASVPAALETVERVLCGGCPSCGTASGRRQPAWQSGQEEEGFVG